MALGTAHETITTAANYIPEIWSLEVIAAYKANNVMRNLVTVFPHNGKLGDTIRIPGFTRALPTAKAAETVVTFVSATHGITTILLDQHFNYAKMIDDIVAIQAMNSLRQAYTDDAGYGLARQVDYAMHTLGTSLNGGTLDASPGTPDANTLLYDTGAVIGSDGNTAWNDADAGNAAALSDVGIRRVMRTLDDNDIPVTERAWILPPVEKASILGLPRFTEAAFQGSGAPINTGLIGNLYGTPVYVSTNAANSTTLSGTVAVRACLHIHKSAFGLAEQLSVRTQTQYVIQFLGDAFIADTIYGTAELRNDGGLAVIVPA